MFRVASAIGAVVGLLAFLYAGASLTGNWLATPLWWEGRERDLAAETRERANYEELQRTPLSGDFGPNPISVADAYRIPPPGEVWVSVPRRGRILISASVAAFGMMTAALSLWHLRRGAVRSS